MLSLVVGAQAERHVAFRRALTLSPAASSEDRPPAQQIAMSRRSPLQPRNLAGKNSGKLLKLINKVELGMLIADSVKS